MGKSLVQLSAQKYVFSDLENQCAWNIPGADINFRKK
jgi:hypothetical protein